MAETRTGNFFATATNSHPETAPQVAETHQGFAVCGYELAPGYAQAAESAPSLSNQALRGIRSLEKQIAAHEAKLAEFIKNPTVRPGMEGQSQAVIKAAQEARIRHLQREIDAFKGNIEKLKNGGG